MLVVGVIGVANVVRKINQDNGVTKIVLKQMNLYKASSIKR